MDTLLRDLRLAVRSLGRHPIFAAIAVVTLALGIGATTALFSVINATMLKPLPYEAPERLMHLAMTVERPTEARTDSLVWSYPKWATFRDAQRSFESVAAYASMNMNLTGTAEPERLRVELVSGPYFELLGIAAQVGRRILPSDDSRGNAQPVVVLSHGLWARRFGSDPAIVGRTIAINKHALTVVGVAPAGFAGLSGAVDVWTPLGMATQMYYSEALEERWSHWLDGIGRVRDGITLSQAQAEVKALGNVVREAHPSPGDGGTNTWGAAALSLRDARDDASIRRSLFVLLGAVGFVLLIGCVNVANLMLARAAGRERETAVRIALGAGRRQLIRQLLTESVLVAVAGGTLGLLIAVWGMDLLITLAPTTVGLRSSQASQFLDLTSVGLDLTVLAFAAAITLLTGLLTGLAPAIRSTRTDLAGAVKQGAAGSLMGGGVSMRRLSGRSVLVAGDVALSLVLLIGAGLLLKSFARARGADVGFSSERLLTFRLEPGDDSMYQGERAAIFRAGLLERLAALPGVEGTAVNYCAPLSSACNGSIVMHIEGRPDPTAGSSPEIGVHVVNPGYFTVLGIRLLSGRAFTDADRRGAQKVAVINQAAARKYFAGANPIGQRMRVGIGFTGEGQTAEIVGVVNDVQYDRLSDPPAPAFYAPFLQYGSARGLFFVRASGDPKALTASVRRELLAYDRNIPLFDLKTMDERVGSALSTMRFGAFLLGIFAVMAVLLASIGIYGVMAYSVAQRTREIGVRMALGALRRDVVSMIVRQGLSLTLVGLFVGLGAAFALRRLLASMLYDVSASDPATFVLIPVALAAVATLASYIPARRAARVEPVEALRSE